MLLTYDWTVRSNTYLRVCASQRLAGCVALLLMFGFFCGTANAQDFFVETSTPAHGATNVRLSDTVSFSFNRQVGIGTDWNTEFVYEPADSLEYDEVSLCLTALDVCDSGDDIPRHVRYRVEHQPNTDYTWLVYAVQTVDGDRMTKPYVLRYTTASEIGSGKIAGSVARPEKMNQRGTSLRSSLRTLVHGLKRSKLGRPVFEPDESTASRSEKSSGAVVRPAAHFETVGGKSKSGGPFTQILLIDKFSISESQWDVRSADALIGSSGTYSLDFVRPGSYVPIAVRYTDGTNTEIDALGFHDPDGDGTPNTVEVDGEETTNVDLQLYSFSLRTARAPDRLSLAVDSAGDYANDQELRRIQAGYGIRPSGTAYEWTYHFYSSSKNLATEVTVDPLEVTVDTSAASETLTDMKPMPDGFVDSDEALQIALDHGGQAFVDSFGVNNITTILEGGNLFWTDAPNPSEEFWHVRLFGETSTSVDVFERYVNIETGEILPVEMTGFTATAEGATVRLRWKTVSETNNAGFEVQHAAGDSSAASEWVKLAFIKGAGTTEKPQTYRFRAQELEPGPHRFRLKQVDFDGTERLTDVVTADVRMKTRLRLTPPSPNPVRQVATLHFGVKEGVGVKEGRRATVAIYDVLGRKVATLYDGVPPVGHSQSVRVNANRLSSGTYFVRLTTQNHTRSRRMIVVK